MSVFTSLVTKTLDVPNDPGQSVTIRKLAPKHLKAAQKASQLESIADLRQMGGPAFLKELKEIGDDKEVQKAIAQVDPLAKFDRVLIMDVGVTAWTYDVPHEPEYFEDLDDDTSDWLAREILKLAKPSLFVVVPEDEKAAEAHAENEQKEAQAALPGA